MTPDLDRPWLPTLAQLAQDLEPGCEVFDLYPIGEDKATHNFMEPSKCRCFPVMEAYASEAGPPDVVVFTHQWTQ